MLKRLAIVLCVLFLCAVGVVGAFAWQMDTALQTPLAVAAEGTSVVVAPGASFAKVVEQLTADGLLEDGRWLRWYGRLSGDAARVRAGEYRIEPGATPRSLLAKFVDGDVQLYSFTIVEGWTFAETLAAMAREPAIVSSLTSEDGPRLLSELGGDYAHPEGLFLPETYRFPRGTRDVDVLRQAHELLQAVLAEAWSERAVGLPLTTPYDALILASIIEKETALASERPRISGVFVRRLELGMRLQTDPTVIYGLGADFDGNLTRRNLRSDTPYNTYTRGGLPPTPIALPGRAAIQAAVNPASGNEIYFVATGLGDGSHKFSATKDEHDAAVREYLERQRVMRRQNP